MLHALWLPEITIRQGQVGVRLEGECPCFAWPCECATRYRRGKRATSVYEIVSAGAGAQRQRAKTGNNCFIMLFMGVNYIYMEIIVKYRFVLRYF
jgi:hypothetical protein